MCGLCDHWNEWRLHCNSPPLCLGMHECHQLPHLLLCGKCPKTLIIMVNHPWDWSRGDPTVTDWWCKTWSLHWAACVESQENLVYTLWYSWYYFSVFFPVLCVYEYLGIWSNVLLSSVFSFILLCSSAANWSLVPFILINNNVKILYTKQNFPVFSMW